MYLFFNEMYQCGLSEDSQKLRKDQERKMVDTQLHTRSRFKTGKLVLIQDRYCVSKARTW